MPTERELAVERGEHALAAGRRVEVGSGSPCIRRGAGTPAIAQNVGARSSVADRLVDRGGRDARATARGARSAGSA